MKTPEIETFHDLLRWRDSLIPLLHSGQITRRQFAGRIEKQCAIYNAKYRRECAEEEVKRQIRERTEAR